MSNAFCCFFFYKTRIQLGVLGHVSSFFFILLILVREEWHTILCGHKIFNGVSQLPLYCIIFRWCVIFTKCTTPNDSSKTVSIYTIFQNDWYNLLIIFGIFIGFYLFKRNRYRILFDFIGTFLLYKRTLKEHLK